MNVFYWNVARIIRWHDLAVLGWIVMLVVAAFAMAGETTLIDLIFALGVSLLIFGSIYLLIGLFDGIPSHIRTSIHGTSVKRATTE